MMKEQMVLKNLHSLLQLRFATPYIVFDKSTDPLLQDLKRGHSTQNTPLDPERLSRRDKRSEIMS